MGGIRTPGRTLRAGARRAAGLLVAAAVLAGLAAPAGANEWTFRTGLRLDAYTGAGQDGHQVLAPYSLAFDAVRWGLGIQGAYGNSERDPGVGPSGSLTGFTDTTLSGYFRLELAGTEIRLGLDLDLPTGVSRLSARQTVAIQDQNLATLQRFGEGLDVNPTLTAYRNFGIFGLGGGLGYLRTGEYNPSRDPGPDLDPGDELTVVVLGDLYATDTIRLVARLGYTYFTADERDGQETLQEGDEIDIQLTTEWRPEPWWATLTLRDIIRFKAERPTAAGRLDTEPRNSNGNEFRATVTVGYILNDQWNLQGAVDVVHIAANDLPAGDALRDGGRTKVAFGPGIAWTPVRTIGVEAFVRYFLLDTREGPFFPRAGTIHGVHADLRLTYRF
jgi:hypothetical protein